MTSENRSRSGACEALRITPKRPDGLGWGVHNLDVAFRRWQRADAPSGDLQEQLRNWRSGVEMRGIDGLDPWAVIREEDDFVARVPGTSVLVSGTLVAYEQLVIVEGIEGKDG